MDKKTKLKKNLRRLYLGTKTIGNLIKYKITKKPTPVCVLFQITKRCNLRCIYCYADQQNLASVPDLSYADYTRLIDEIAALGGHWIRFLGGEPLMRNDIGAMVDYAYKNGMLTEMNTNGYFMKQRAQEIKNLDSLVISIDGAKEVTDICRGQGTYDKCIEAIEIAKDLGIAVRLHGCLSKYHTQADIDHLAELSVKYGIAFNFSAPSPIYYNDDMRMEGHPTQAQVAMLHQRCKELKALGYPLINTNVAADYVRLWPNPNSDVITKEDVVKLNLKKGSFVPCVAGKLYCCVDIDGKVYPCAGHWRDGLNSLEVGFEKAWRNLWELECVSCNYLASIELSLLYRLNPKTIWEVASYIIGRTAKAGRQKISGNK